MKEQTPFDDFFRDRLGEHESPFSDSIFDRLMSEREEAMPSENPTQFFKDKLEDLESPVPKGLFDTVIKSHEENLVGDFFKNALENHTSAVPAGMFEGMMQTREESQTGDIFKGKLDNHASAVPADMFERIMGKRKRRIIWWQPRRVAVAALVLFLGFGAMGYLFMNKKENIEEIVTNTSQNDKNTVEERNPMNSGNEVVSKEKNQISIDNQSITHNDIIISDKNANKDERLLSASSQTKLKTTTTSKITNRTINSTVSTPTNTITTNPIPDFSEPKGTVPSQQNQFSEQTISKTDDQKPQNTIYLIQALPLVQNLPIGQGVAFSSEKSKLTNESLCAMLPDGCPTFGRRRMGKTWFIEAYGAPELMMRRLKPNSSEFESYRLARDTSETVLLGYAAGVRAAMVFDNGIVVKGGVSYVNGRERFVRDSVGYGKVTTTTVFDPVTGVTDTTIEREVGFYRTTRFNQYRSLDFSLQGGYEMALGSNFTLGFNAGANINLWQSKKANFYDSALQLQDMSNNENVFNQYLGVNLVGSITAYWQMTDKMQLMVEPYVRHYLKPITNSNYQIQQSYTNMGLAIGLRYRL
jgi:hypothetical protein